MKIHEFSALAFAPIEDVEGSFQMLCDSIEYLEDCQPVFDYFEDTWTGQPHHSGHRQPWLPHALL